MTETVTALALARGISSADGARVSIVICRVMVVNWLGRMGCLYRVTAVAQKKPNSPTTYKLAKNYRDLETAAQAFYQAVAVVGLLGQVEYGNDSDDLLKLLEADHHAH